MNKLQAFKVFVQIGREGNLSMAGRRLGLSAASVSRLLSSLESELGAQLLNRNSRTLTLTEAGSLYLAKVGRILCEIDEADEGVKSASQHPNGLIRVHTTAQLGSRLIAPILPEFCAQYPDVDVELRTSDSYVNILKEEFDLQIRLGRMDDSSLIVKRLMTTELALCASPSYVAANGLPDVPSALAAHKCLFWRVNNETPVWRFLRNGRREDVRVPAAIKSNSAEILRTLALQGAGIALLRDWSVASDFEAGRLVRLLPSFKAFYTEHDDGMYAVFNASKHLPARVRVLVDFLTMNFAIPPHAARAEKCARAQRESKVRVEHHRPWAT